MSMFGKSDNVEQEMQKVENEAISSIIDNSQLELMKEKLGE